MTDLKKSTVGGVFVVLKFNWGCRSLKVSKAGFGPESLERKQFGEGSECVMLSAPLMLPYSTIMVPSTSRLTPAARVDYSLNAMYP